MRNEASSTSLLPFSRNENGHYTIEIIGDSRASERLLDGHEGVLVDDFARSALMSDDYNESHRLEDGKKYTISLVPGGRQEIHYQPSPWLGGYGEVHRGQHSKVCPELRLQNTARWCNGTNL